MVFMNEETTGAPVGGHEFDRAGMAQLARMSLRGRSIAEAMEETGVSRSMYSKLLNQKLNNPPTINTLRRLAIGNPPELLRRMLEICGYPRDLQEEIDMLVQAVQETPVLTGTGRWSASQALALVLDSLKDRGCGEKADIEYRPEGLFTVDIGAAYPVLVCIPLVLQGLELRSNQVVKLALALIARAMTLWGLEETAFLVLTDSPGAYRLLKRLPNRSKIMAVALASGDGRGFERQCTILPKQPVQKMTGAFPVDLSASVDEPVTDAG